MVEPQRFYKRAASDPFWWSLFAAGGTVAAFLVPIHILIHGIAAPVGLMPESAVAYERMRALIQSPWVRLYLFFLISLPLFHWAHRFRFLLEDLGLHRGRAILAVLCYGAAVVLTAVTIGVLVRAG
jgi:fumarate reductase subunit D